LFGFILSLLMNREPAIRVMINILLLAGGLTFIPCEKSILLIKKPVKISFLTIWRQTGQDFWLNFLI